MPKPILAVAKARQKPQPTTEPLVIPSLIPSQEEIEAWLLSRHIGAWGQIFTIIEGKDGVTRASAWIQHQIESFLEFHNA